MFYTLEKFERRMREMERFRYFDLNCILPFECMEGVCGKDEINNAIPACIKGFELNLGDTLEGKDRYFWAQKTVRLPQAREDGTVVGVFDFGKVGGGHNSGFESLLFVNGHPYQAVDTNHNDVVFERFAGQEVTLTFLLWTGLTGVKQYGEVIHRIRQAQLGYLHKATDELYYYAKAIYKTVKLLPEEDCTRCALIAAMEKALKELNWDEDKFYSTVPQALKVLEDELSQMEKHSDITVNCVGHTHIDVAWLWRMKHTREKAMRSFSTVLRLMDEFDDYVFLQTQPQLYQFLKNDCPELYEQIRQKIRDGQWKADGGMWLEADCNITSGESLVRQFLYGIRFLKQEFGVQCQYLWLPDVFGYSWALPQIMKLCGLKTFMTTKISWNQYNTMPHDLFWWRGIDGTEMLTYFITTPELGHGLDDRYSTYNGFISPRTVLGSWKKFRDKNISYDTLISYGFGDGGGGVNRNMLKMRRVLDKLPGLPNVKQTDPARFFDKLHENVENTDEYVATWDGELYLEYHRGTYTTQGYTKRMNRQLEFKLAQSEWLSSLDFLASHRQNYEKQTFDTAWQTLLHNQFHDIIPGSSIHAVYEDTRREYEQIDRDLDALGERLYSQLLTPAENGYTVSQFSAFDREDLVHIAHEKDGAFYDAGGNRLPAQRSGDGYDLKLMLKPLALTPIIFRQDETAVLSKSGSPFHVNLTEEGGEIVTPYYRIELNRDGQLTRIFDLENDREVIAPGGLGNVLEVFEDKPMDYDAWDIDIYYTQKREIAKLLCRPELCEDGELKLVVRFFYGYNRSQIMQDLILYAFDRRIDFVTKVDWAEDHRLLKAAFAVDVRSTQATYDIQFGHVQRPTHFNTSWDYARFEVVAHKWADLSEQNYGVALLNNCKYGHNIKDNVMKLSLLKSSKEPDASADMGTHRFTYSLFPHLGGPVEGGVIEESVKLNLRPMLTEGGVPRDGRQLFRFSSSQVYLDAVKKAEDEDCLILRVHECHGGHAAATVTSDYHIDSYAECNLLEETTGALCRAEENCIPLTLRPFEIKTFKVFLREN